MEHTPEEAKIAYLNALQWKAIGIPARGVCVGNWSEAIYLWPAPVCSPLQVPRTQRSH
jgi:hypothetical protein